MAVYSAEKEGFTCGRGAKLARQRAKQFWLQFWPILVLRSQRVMANSTDCDQTSPPFANSLAIKLEGINVVTDSIFTSTVKFRY